LPLATLKIEPKKHVYKRGENIGLSVILQPRGDGIYIAKEWGHAGGYIPGFWVTLKTLDGKTLETSAEICEGVADAYSEHLPPAEERLRTEFLYLPKGNFLGWETSIECLPKQPGRYWLEASYAPNVQQIESVARLPETKGLVRVDVVEAEPVEIVILSDQFKRRQ
jgi:hypothetical protein